MSRRRALRAPWWPGGLSERRASHRCGLHITGRRTGWRQQSGDGRRRRPQQEVRLLGRRSQARVCADSTTLSYLVVSCRLAGGLRGKKGLRGCFYDPPWQLLGWRLGSKDCCCGWPLLGSQECSAPSPSRALCCRLCLTFKGQKKQAWKEVARHPPLFAGPVGPARAGRRPRMSGCAGCRRPAGPCPSAAALGRWPAPVQWRQRRLNSCAGRRRPLPR